MTGKLPPSSLSNLRRRAAPSEGRVDQAELVAFRAHGVVCTYRQVEEAHRACHVYDTAEMKA